MLRKLRHTALAALVALSAAPSIALADAPASAGALPVPLLWKVSDADNAVYLLGSFHLLKESDYPLAPEVDAAFEDSAALVFEVEPSELTSLATAQKFAQAATYEDGKSLSSVLPEDVKNRLGQLLSASGASLAQVEASEPWAITLGMVMGIAQSAGFRPEQGLDQHFIRRASEAGKPVAGLETVDVQVAAMDKAPYSEQVYSLNELISDPARTVRQLHELHEAWRKGDTEKLDGKMRQEMIAHTPVSYRMLNVDRNNAWMPAIEKRLTAPGTDNTLIVVGALHLMGEDGVVEKLRAKGYQVERLCSACAAGQN
ncbi:TraB/GumN family protein [Pseudoxanthomonas mexicana]|uniref:TraB/GumN family protein n=1 Tax=Pseudoxanthomonas mexicana TaxID=128785 RepID=UPI00398B35F4